MPELPEIRTIAGQMREKLIGKTLTYVEVRQPKCLNMTEAPFKELVTGQTVRQISAKGKWIFIRFTGGVHLLISLGMGGEIIYHAPGDAPGEGYRFLFTFDDGGSFHVSFYWFGYVHAVRDEDLAGHTMTAGLGADPFDAGFTADAFSRMLRGRRGGVKSWLMNQHNIAGIGNVYIQDILFKARLHPNRKIESLNGLEIIRLHESIREHLEYASGLGGLMWEKDFYGNPGRYAYKLVGHRPGEACPVCGAVIQEIRTGSTRSFVCENCQKAQEA